MKKDKKTEWILPKDLKEKWDEYRRTLPDLKKSMLNSIYTKWKKENWVEYRNFLLKSKNEAYKTYITNNKGARKEYFDEYREKRLATNKELKTRLENGEKMNCLNKMKCCGGADNAVTVYNQLGPLCEKGRELYVKRKVADHKKWVNKSERNKQLNLERIERAKKKKKIDYINALNDTIAIAKVFNPVVYFTIDNVIENLVREHIFGALYNLIGLYSKNETVISKTRLSYLLIDLYIPEFNIFVEYKNTHYTNEPKSYKEQLEYQYQWIKEDPRYQDALLISVSTNGSMGDMNIIQFCDILHDYYLFKHLSTGDLKAKEVFIKLRRLIKRLNVEVGHLMTTNRWPSITAEKVIKHMQEHT